jgi:hypothetical protein
LFCDKNQLTNLDIRKNTALNSFLWNLGNANLKTICITPSQVTKIGKSVTHNWDTREDVQYSTICDEILTSVQDEQQTKASVINAFNLQGVEIPINTKNQLIILLYDNGQTQKVFVD